MKKYLTDVEVGTRFSFNQNEYVKDSNILTNSEGFRTDDITNGMLPIRPVMFGNNGDIWLGQAQNCHADIIVDVTTFNNYHS